MNKITLVAAALAATCTVAVPAYAEAPNGPRAEAILGWDHFNGDTSLDDDGVTYGIGLGYDYAISGKSALGIDAEFTDSNGEQTKPLGADVTAKLSADRELYVGGRYTYAANDKINLFATAGYTNQRINVASSIGQEADQDLDGVRVGAGVQYNITDKLYWTTSYRYSNYEAGLDRSQVVTGIGFRF